jgi:hypothetical protein
VPLALPLSKLSLSEISMEAGVAGGPKESLVIVFLICISKWKGRRKENVALNFFRMSVLMIAGSVKSDDGVVGVG